MGFFLAAIKSKFWYSMKVAFFRGAPPIVWRDFALHPKLLRVNCLFKWKIRQAYRTTSWGCGKKLFTIFRTIS
jgi:hypothetical protein